jgi:ElaB/YqjD/DUF883 family membrane-anchored ribosome-binding protein
VDATTTDSGQSKVQTAKEEAVSQAQSVAETAVDQTKQVVNEVTDAAKSQIGEQKTRLASSIRQIGEELDQASQNSSGTVASIASQAATTSRQISTWIDTHDARDVLGEVESFARQRPVVFVLGATALGFLVGRVTRSAVSAARDNSSRSGQTIDLRQDAIVPPPVVGTAPIQASDPHLTGDPMDAALLGEASGPTSRGYQTGGVGVGEALPGVDTTIGQGRREGSGA